VPLIESIWTGNAASDKLARTLLSPLELAFRGIVGLRGRLYDKGALEIKRSRISVVSVGNLTVGGTGKTPISSWIASRLAASGRAPAIILRGYGADETLVHKHLNPAIPVIEASDRVSGISVAAQTGADVAILDDAFQHRRAARDVDIVLISADDWTGHRRLLPAGPYREPVEGIRRATMVIITRKAASDSTVASIESFLRQTAPGVLLAVAGLGLTDIVNYGEPGRTVEMRAVRDKSVLAIAAIGNPRAFFNQLEAYGARVVRRIFADHHAFTRSEIAELAAQSGQFDYVVCTLKDAVKLGVEWPADARPLWYVSLSVNVESGGAALDEILSRLDRSKDI
jgi:tetraacyldisaccharide 4'-kinase